VVRVARANAAAAGFRERTASAYTGGVFAEHDHQGRQHTFRVFVFASRSPHS
jgi:hypothetical protein